MNEKYISIANNLSDTISTKDKEILLKKSLDSVENNCSFKKFSNIWDNFSEKEKRSIYNDGDYLFSVKSSAKRSVKRMKPLKSPFRSSLIGFLEKNSIKEQITKNSFEMISVAIRFMIHFGILKKPNSVSRQTLLKNIKKDAKNIKKTVFVLEKAAMIVPELKPILPVLQEMKPIIKSSSDIVTKLMLEKQQNIYLSEISKHTSLEISDILLSPEKLS